MYRQISPISRVFLFALLCMAFIGCSEDDTPEVTSCGDCITGSRFPEYWAIINYDAYISSFFGDTTWERWPDNVVEIGLPQKDTLLVATRITFPLIDTISGSYYRNYLAKSGFYNRSFRLVVANNDTMDVDSVFVQVATESEGMELYGDIPPITMIFYQAEKLDDRIYFQNHILKGEERGKPVLFSQTPSNAGDFDEAYVLVIKEKTDRFNFRYVLMPEPIIAPEDTCKKVEFCQEVEIPFSEQRCSSDSAQSAVATDSLSDLDSSVFAVEPVTKHGCLFIDGIRHEVRCDSVCEDWRSDMAY